MKRCKSCLTNTGPETGACPVCGIDPDKPRKDLTATERHVRRSVRNIRLVAMLHLIAAGIGIMALPEIQKPVVVALLSVLNVILAAGLIRYDFRAYRLAVVCYFGLGMVNVISVNLPAIPLILLLLYVIGNKTAKAAFERRLSAV
jgi:hypothetical protein